MKIKTAIFFILAILIMVGITAFYISEQHVTMSPTDHGNTAGNLHNSGLFFEMDGKVYFSNSNDSNCLYSMNVDESKPKRLTSMGVKYISGAKDFLYFYMDSTKVSGNVSGLGTATNQFGIYRCRTSGRSQTCLLRDFCGEVQLCGEYLYYQVKTNGGSLQKIRVDQNNKSEISTELISPVCYDNGVIYYTGVTNDHNIHAMFTNAGDSENTVVYGNYFFPVVSGSYIYYMNGDDDYKIYRTNLMDGSQEKITEDRVDCFTMDSNYIYYSTSVKNFESLRRCDLNGNGTVAMFYGITNSLNVTSRYLYFKVYGNDNVMYHIPLDGSAPASVFDVKVQ
ncbi:MAG: DUF5050 domain-containing protein [Butyrivibrio sp.]|nr:DUF5050 domain-containing protein [Butyrivibrio sp.]